MPQFTAAELAERVGGALEGDGSIEIHGLESVANAGEREITFVGDEHHARAWAESHAGCVILSEGLTLADRQGSFAVIRVTSADHAMISLLELFEETTPEFPTGIDPTAIVHPDAHIGNDVTIGPHCTIGRGCVLGDRVRLFGGVQLNHDVHIGAESTLYSSVSIGHSCILGERTIIHANAVIGTDGFGFRPSEDGSKLIKVPHIGNVIIGDDVEIGSCTCVDRGKFGATRVGNGTKIDNLCQISHNCIIGEQCVICGQVGIAGSTQVGHGTQIGGGAGVADHLVIGNRVSIGARSGVMNNIPDGEIWYGAPAGERSRILREHAAIRRLPEWSKRLRRMIEANSVED